MSEYQKYGLREPYVHLYYDENKTMGEVGYIHTMLEAKDKLGNLIPLNNDGFEISVELPIVDLYIDDKIYKRGLQRFRVLETNEIVVIIDKHVSLKNDNIFFWYTENDNLLDVSRGISIFEKIEKSKVTIKGFERDDVVSITFDALSKTKEQKDIMMLIDNIISCSKKLDLDISHFKMKDIEDLCIVFSSLDTKDYADNEVFTKKISGKFYAFIKQGNRFFSYDSCLVKQLIEKGGKKHNVPKYMKFNTSFLKYLHISKNALLEDAKSINIFDMADIKNLIIYYINRLNWVYDETKEDKFLEVSLYFAQALCLNNTENNFLIYMKTVCRKTDVLFDEFQRARLKYIKTNTDNIENKFLACVLLGDRESAKNILRKLKKDEYASFKRKGLIKLYKNL